ncbi:MAG TPA: lysophospholipid acyltransferase family protein, partial [Candidatus Synoicihabitans sp.]|nr:lysophospholipid acyltransferase family protein [Candidatus Synoicihabitans sp.]
MTAPLMSDSTRPPFVRSALPWLLDKIASWIAPCLYRVRSSGHENLPAGGALILANHLSYADVVALQLACPRPLRYVGFEAFAQQGWIFRKIYEWAGVIPISRGSALASTRRVAQALQAGELVCMFPEGGISRTGQLMKLKRGFEVMAIRAGVPVVPVAHDGLWGSIFSFSG